MTKAELLDLKAEIDEAQESATKLEGKKETLTEQLEKKWGVKTPVEAKKKLKTMQKEIEKLDEEIETKTKSLEDQLNEQDTNDTE